MSGALSPSLGSVPGRGCNPTIRLSPGNKVSFCDIPPEDLLLSGQGWRLQSHQPAAQGGGTFLLGRPWEDGLLTHHVGCGLTVSLPNEEEVF
jgi:hypothetical protein